MAADGRASGPTRAAPGISWPVKMVRVVRPSVGPFVCYNRIFLPKNSKLYMRVRFVVYCTANPRQIQNKSTTSSNVVDLLWSCCGLQFVFLTGLMSNVSTILAKRGDNFDV